MMKIILGISDEDMEAVRSWRALSYLKCEDYSTKEDTDDGLTDLESREYSDWLSLLSLLERMEGVIDNQQIIHYGKRSAMASLDIRENKEYKEIVAPYVNRHADQITCSTVIVQKDVLRFPGAVFKNKKLLPYDGRTVQVIEYRYCVSVFLLPEGKHIIDLYKDRFCSR